MAYVPIVNLDESFKDLQKTLPASLKPVIGWLETYYLGWFSTIISLQFTISGKLQAYGTRRAALFPVETWNLVERVLNDEDRTNNYAGAFKCL